MRLTTAMLADSAQVQNGKLYILGGGFDTITARKLPMVYRSVSLALVAEVEPDERHRDLEIAIRLIDEDGTETGVRATGKLRVGSPPNLPPGSTSIVPMVSPFHNIQFTEAKGYAFVIDYDETELARVSFRVFEAG